MLRREHPPCKRRIDIALKLRKDWDVPLGICGVLLEVFQEGFKLGGKSRLVKVPAIISGRGQLGRLLVAGRSTCGYFGIAERTDLCRRQCSLLSVFAVSLSLHKALLAELVAARMSENRRLPPNDVKYGNRNATH